jgi:hypothetical protein
MSGVRREHVGGGMERGGRGSRWRSQLALRAGRGMGLMG